MLTNIDQHLYPRFKREGYRIKRYQVVPVQNTTDILQLAYLDVNRTIRGINDEQSSRFKKVAANLRSNLSDMLPDNQEAFDSLHHQSCQKCIEISALGPANIHYGQAQKLINMSLKYSYNEFATYHGIINYLEFPDNNIEWLFHLPIDNQIRNHLINIYDFVDPTPLPWSQWDYDHYINFQNQVRDRLNENYVPLEIDYLLWNDDGAALEQAIH